MDQYTNMALHQAQNGSLVTVFVAFAIIVPASEACLRFLNWCMFQFSDMR